MKLILPLVFLAFAATGLSAQDTGETAETEAEPAPPIILSDEDVALKDFKWTNRPLVVFAESPNDPRFIEQMEYITEGLDELAERDVVVLTDTDPDADSPLREELRPRGFMLALVGKDGTVYLRKPVPWSVREITRVIDKMPMRQQEIRRRRGDS